MPYASLLLRLPEELIRIFRKYEQEMKKEINTLGLWFLIKPVYQKKIWPKFTNSN